MARPYGTDLAQDRPIVSKKEPKPCTRCGILTRHRCKRCGVIECALCLNPADRCANCVDTV